MAEEVRTLAAAGLFAETEDKGVQVPSDKREIIAKLDEIVNKYEQGDVLSEEDANIVAAYLPAIGVDETAVGSDNSLLGKGTFKFNTNELGCEVEASGELGCKDAGEGRTEWWADMTVKRLGGDARVVGYTFFFTGASFGMGPTGQLKLLYKREYSRSFEAAQDASASFFDRTTNVQWGFYYTARCEVITDQGILVIWGA